MKLKFNIIPLVYQIIITCKLQVKKNIILPRRRNKFDVLVKFNLLFIAKGSREQTKEIITIVAADWYEYIFWYKIESKVIKDNLFPNKLVLRINIHNLIFSELNKHKNYYKQVIFKIQYNIPNIYTKYITLTKYHTIYTRTFCTFSDILTSK